MRRRLSICFLLLTLITPFLFAQTRVNRWTGKVDVKALSAGAKTWVLGAQQKTSSGMKVSSSTVMPSFGSNINVADPFQDVASGQSEVSIAAIENLVMAAWTDSSGLITQPSTNPSGSATGIGFSSDAGKTYEDLIGLPNDNIQQQWFGDPIVVALDKTHFVVASLYWPNADMLIGTSAMLSPCAIEGAAHFYVALSVVTVGEANEVSFTNPIPVATGGDMCSNPDDLAFLDREAMAFDPETRVLAVGYSRFFVGNAGQAGTGQIEVVRAVVPEDPVLLTSADFSAPIVVWSEEPTVINTGVAVAVANTGDIYVAWERNWLSNLVNGTPLVSILASRIQTCDCESPVSTPVVVTMGQMTDPDGGVKSIDSAADIVGYHVAVGNDFPQMALNKVTEQLVIVWNDASKHPLGDIFMRALNLDMTLPGSIQKVNDESGALHFMPAVSIRADGGIATSWYDRSAGGPASALTDYSGELRPDVDTNSPDFTVSTGATDWLTTASLVSPNFGDYTANFTLGSTTHFMWTDGRLGVAQPFTDQKTLDPDFETTISPMTSSIDWNKSGTYELTVKANELFKGDVTLTCGQLPDGIKCQFDHPTLTLLPGQQLTAKLTLATGDAAKTLAYSRGMTILWTSFGTFGFILLGGVAARRRVMIAMTAIVLILLLSMVGCGQGSSSVPNSTVSPVTGPQPMPVTVPITIAQVGGTITHSISLNVTVMK